MRLYLECYVYDDSSAPVWLRFWCCDGLVLDKFGIHAVAFCFTGRGRAARHDRPATIFIKWLASPAGIVFRGKYGRGESKCLLFETKYRPAEALVFPLLAAPAEDLSRPTAIEFVVNGCFNSTND